MEWGGLLLQAIMLGCFLLWEGYFKQKGKNLADKDDIRDITYESEKGKNLATKEDLEVITKKIEVIKNEISFENQRKHTYIEQRTDRFIKITYLTEELLLQQSLLLFYLYDSNAIDKYAKIIENTNTILLSLIHEGNILSMSVDNEKINKVIGNIIDNSQSYTSFLCYIASVAMGSLWNSEKLTELANQNRSKELLATAIENKNKIKEIRTEFETEITAKRSKVQQSLAEYMTILTELFHKEFHIKLEIDTLKKQ